MRKTRLMLEVERRRGCNLEQLLPDLLTRKGLAGAARELEVSASGVGHWMLKLGIGWKVVALYPGDVATIYGPRGIRTLEG